MFFCFCFFKKSILTKNLSVALQLGIVLNNARPLWWLRASAADAFGGHFETEVGLKKPAATLREHFSRYDDYYAARAPPAI